MCCVVRAVVRCHLEGSDHLLLTLGPASSGPRLLNSTAQLRMVPRLFAVA